MPSDKPRDPKRFLSNVSKPDADDIFLLHAKDATGQPAWYYVRATKSRKKLMRSLEGKTNISIADYGEVIVSGYGETVPEATRKMMREEYGYAD